MLDRSNGKTLNLQAVIFDYGDVLCSRPTAGEIEDSARILGIAPDQFRTLWGRHRDAFDRGDLSSDGYWRKFAEDAGRSVDAAQLRDLAEKDVAMWSRINPDMIAWLEDLSRTGVKTAVLSNMHADMAEYARKNFQWLTGVSFVTLSAEVRMIKPDPAIYQHCLQGLGVAASQALFIDDREVNIAAAIALGIHGIQFSSIAQLRGELEAARLPILLPETQRQGRPRVS
jgi:putative hydrolase of the HAD superfamily